MTTSKSETAANAAETAREKTAEATASIRTESVKKAEGAKSSLAEEISKVASALKVASREFSEESTEAKAFNQVAQNIANASEAVRQKSIGDVFSDLNSFARRNPAAFLGGAALLGFAASRFAKASGETTGTGAHSATEHSRSEAKP